MPAPAAAIAAAAAAAAAAAFPLVGGSTWSGAWIHGRSSCTLSASTSQCVAPLWSVTVFSVPIARCRRSDSNAHHLSEGTCKHSQNLRSKAAYHALATGGIRDCKLGLRVSLAVKEGLDVPHIKNQLQLTRKVGGVE